MRNFGHLGMHIIAGELAQVIDIRLLNELRFLHIPAHRIQVSGVLQRVIAFVTNSRWEFVLDFVRLLLGWTFRRDFCRLDWHQRRCFSCSWLRVLCAGVGTFGLFRRTASALLHSQFFRMHTKLVRATVGTVGEGSFAEFAFVWSSTSVQITVIL